MLFILPGKVVQWLQDFFGFSFYNLRGLEFYGFREHISCF